MREIIATSFCNVLFFAIATGVTTVSPEADKFNPKAFGARPFGFPVNRVVFVAVSILYFPMVPGVCGLVRSKFIQVEIEKAGTRQDWEEVERLYEMQRVSNRFAVFGGVYFASICVIWIIWTGIHGL